MNSIAPLLWAIVFLALTIGVFSIVFLQGRLGLKMGWVEVVGYYKVQGRGLRL